jgi:sugar/nucleoside kinase (ribokinase family)
VIVVLGCPAAQTVDGAVRAAGLAGWIAVEAATAGAEVQVVGRIGDDPTGDAVVLGLGLAGVGHAALLRDPARPTAVLADEDEWPDDVLGEPSAAVAATPSMSLDAEDVALGLRYLTAFSVLVIADSLDPAALAAALDAGAFAGARLVAVAPDPDAVIAATDVFVAPTGDPGTFARMLGRYAAALDTGQPPDDALKAAAAATGWAPAATDDEA